MNRNITALILVVLGIGIYFTYTQNQIYGDNGITSISAVNDQYSTAIGNAEALKAVRDNVQKDFNKISADDQARLNTMLPSSVDNIHLIVDISKLSLRRGFPLKNLKAEVVQANGSTPIMTAGMNQGSASTSVALLPTMTLSNVKLTFDATASYQTFISFMQDLESSLRIMDVTHLSIKANDTGSYDYSVEINTYWLK